MGSAVKDKNGLTEAQFLRQYDVTRYFRPSVTVDIAVCVPQERGMRLLLIKRGGHPYIGKWAFPGGFVEKDETCEAAAARELFEETGVSDLPLRQLVTVSTPKRDPRWRNITVVFYAIAKDAVHALGGDDASEARWFDVTCYTDGDTATLNFSECDGGERFASRLRIVRDGFGDMDINGTEILASGGMAFDHAKIVCRLLDTVRG